MIKKIKLLNSIRSYCPSGAPIFVWCLNNQEIVFDLLNDHLEVKFDTSLYKLGFAIVIDDLIHIDNLAKRYERETKLSFNVKFTYKDNDNIMECLKYKDWNIPTRHVKYHIAIVDIEYELKIRNRN